MEEDAACNQRDEGASAAAPCPCRPVYSIPCRSVPLDAVLALQESGRKEDHPSSMTSQTCQLKTDEMRYLKERHGLGTCSPCLHSATAVVGTAFRSPQCLSFCKTDGLLRSARPANFGNQDKRPSRFRTGRGRKSQDFECTRRRRRRLLPAIIL